MKLPFWGQVVFGDTAASAHRSMCLPLGDNGGAGPALFVIGTHNNLKRSDGCIAWAVPPLAKRGRVSEVKADADRSKNKTKVVPLATHVVHHMDMEFGVTGNKYRYQVPYLKEHLICIKHHAYIR